MLRADGCQAYVSCFTVYQEKLLLPHNAICYPLVRYVASIVFELRTFMQYTALDIEPLQPLN